MSQMQKVSLQNIAEIQTGPFGSQLHKEDYVENGTPIVTVEHLGERIFSEQNLPRVSDDDKARLKKYVLDEGDIVFSRVGSVDRCSFVDHDHAGWMFSGRCLRVRPSDKVDPLYLYYFLCLEKTKKTIRSIAVGATMPSINTKILGELEVSLPSLEQQRTISNYLDTLDKKIETNNKIKKNLENQIRNVCKAWLVDFIPFGGDMPDNWKIHPLSKIANFYTGYSYKGEELRNSEIAMATIKNFDRNGGFKINGYKEIRPSDKLKDFQYAELFDTLVAHTDLTQNAEVIGNAEPILSLSKYESIIFSMDLVKVLPKENTVSKFLIAAFLQDKRFKAHCLGYVNGTTVLHLSKKALPEYYLALPDNLSVLEPLDNIISNCYKAIANLLSENMKLAEMRDLILSKMIIS